MEATLDRMDNAVPPPTYDSLDKHAAAETKRAVSQHTFSSLPIVTKHANDPNVARDIADLSAAIANLRFHHRADKAKAKSIRKQLICDLWAIEAAPYGSKCKMGCSTKKLVKTHIKAVEDATKAEIGAAGML